MSGRSHRSSGVGSMVCPACGVGELRHREEGSARCEGCERTVGREVLETLAQIAALPEAQGSRPCECGHPEMGHLPVGTLHCPSCGSGVLPAGSSSTAPGVATEAYLCGWEDGLFGKAESFVCNGMLARFEDAAGRLDYYRGHRAGRSIRF